MTHFTPHLQDIYAQFDVFIVDLWGVLHNGKAAFANAVQALEHLKKLDKPVLLLSNAPRRLAPAKARLAELGIHRSLYQDLYTSGEDCYRHLKDRNDAWYASLGNTLFHMGPERDRNLFDELPFRETKDVKTADFIINTGTLTWESQVEDYEDLLQEAYTKNLPMICANPDKVVMFGDLKALCAGAIAARYQEIGGYVRYHGKPYGEIYATVLSFFPGVEKSRVLAIGDSLTTDILGAKGAGIQALMIMGGIHQHHFTPNHDPLESLNHLMQSHTSKPDFLAPELAW